MDGPGGGHRHGTGRPTKTEFPERWDDDTVVGRVFDVAKHPGTATHQANGRWRVTGHRDDVTVVVILEPNGQIVTAWPLSGGRGVVKNPPKGQT